MVPYLRYLYCLFLVHNDDRDAIIASLGKYGLPAKGVVLDLAYDRFLQKLESHSKSFATCLSIDLYDDEFDACARQLDVLQYFNDRAINPEIFRVASDPLVKKHVECCLLTRVEHQTIIDDVKAVYRLDVSLEDILTFSALFFDESEISDTNNFVKYVELLSSEDERKLKNKCRAQGAEYTRWALGAPIHISVKDMTKEMMTDAYFKYKEAYKDRSPDAFDKAIKLGNLVTKLIDREVKLGTIKGEAEGKDNNTSAAFGEQLCLFDFPEEAPKSLSDIQNEDDNKPNE